MQGNPYIMGLITQAGVIITAILSFITALVQLHSNKKAKDSDKTLVAFKNDVNIKLQENDNNNKAMEKSMMILLRSQIVSKCENYQSLGYLPDYARSCLCDLFEQYTALGGNHGVNLLVDEVLKLPAIKIEK
jgi:hypothetical protein